MWTNERNYRVVFAYLALIASIYDPIALAVGVTMVLWDLISAYVDKQQPKSVTVINDQDTLNTIEGLKTKVEQLEMMASIRK